jgi:dethiobiotin synthetase
MRGVFVTGTGTGVGKTVTSAALMVRFPASCYWKPIQTGPDDDTAEVGRLSQCSPARLYRNGVRLPDPVSPHLAAARANTRIDLRFLTQRAKDSDDSWIVEGAGGALVPVNESDLMVHLMERLGLPVLVVAETKLGTINHTLLTLEALRARRLTVAGVVMVGQPDADNRTAIERFGKVPILGEMPRFERLSSESMDAWARTALDAGKVLEEIFR